MHFIGLILWTQLYLFALPTYSINGNFFGGRGGKFEAERLLDERED